MLGTPRSPQELRHNFLTALRYVLHLQDKLAYRYRTTEEKKEIVVAVWDLDLMRRLMDYVLEDEKLLAHIEEFMATEPLNEDARPDTHRKKLVR